MTKITDVAEAGAAVKHRFIGMLRIKSDLQIQQLNGPNLTTKCRVGLVRQMLECAHAFLQ